MRRLVLEKSVLKDLSPLPAKQYRQVVSAIFDLLTQPYPHYSKQLQGCPYWRIAVGEYRVVYRVAADSIVILAYGKRNDSAIYRAVERKQ
jgi:mRNA interferase RelE/StbE